MKNWFEGARVLELTDKDEVPRIHVKATDSYVYPEEREITTDGETSEEAMGYLETAVKEEFDSFKAASPGKEYAVTVRQPIVYTTSRGFPRAEIAVGFVAL